MLDHPAAPLLVLLLFILSLTLVVLTGNYLNAKARTDALKVCAAHNISLSECDAYWKEVP